MQRYPCDLSHFGFDSGEIGHLQTLACVPVMAGDSMSLDLEGIWRLSPLRRNLVVDCNIDLFAFFVPHRHIYGESWIQFIKDGYNSVISFNPAGPASPPAALSYLGAEFEVNEELPLWMVGGYNQIWNRYFRTPSDTTKEYPITRIPTTADEQRAGYRCGPLPMPWSTGTQDLMDGAEREVPVDVDTFDIVDLNRVQAQYKTEVDREFFGLRYNDILNTAFGSTVNTDADERPTLLGRQSFWLSGYDVDGTDDASLGSYSGKSAGVGRISMRRKFFSEHGALWVMCLPRFPTIHVDERHFLHSATDPSYLEIAGDPSIVSAETPAEAVHEDYFRNASLAQLGVVPYGQWYRYHPSRVHRQYDVLDGFTFMDTQITTKDLAWYISSGEYDEVFQTTQLQHWQSHSRINIRCLRNVPPARVGLYAGA